MTEFGCPCCTLGTSWGARNGGTALAIEPRIRISMLMLSGRYDSVVPYESSQRPCLRVLGSPTVAKKQVLFEGGHFLPRDMWMSESTRWLDQQLGPVNRP